MNEVVLHLLRTILGPVVTDKSLRDAVSCKDGLQCADDAGRGGTRWCLNFHVSGKVVCDEDVGLLVQFERI